MHGGNNVGNFHTSVSILTNCSALSSVALFPLVTCPISWHETIIGPLLAQATLLTFQTILAIIFNNMFSTYFNIVQQYISRHIPARNLWTMLAVARLSILTVPTHPNFPIIQWRLHNLEILWNKIDGFVSTKIFEKIIQSALEKCFDNSWLGQTTCSTRLFNKMLKTHLTKFVCSQSIVLTRSTSIKSLTASS